MLLSEVLVGLDEACLSGSLNEEPKTSSYFLAPVPRPKKPVSSLKS